MIDGGYYNYEFRTGKVIEYRYAVKKNSGKATKLGGYATSFRDVQSVNQQIGTLKNQ